MADLPFQAEYAKSGRASCKGCKQKIKEGTLRLAVMVQSAFYDGKQPNWYHEDCFFQKQRVQSLTEIDNYNILKQADLDRIKKTIESNTDTATPAAGTSKGKGKKGAKREAASSNNLALKDFSIEYSKSSRATCKHCEIKICKDEVRICKMLFDTEVGKKYGGQAAWHHVNCFVAARDELGFMAGGEDIPGFNKLKKNDQKIVKEAIKPMSADEVPNKKIKSEPQDKEEIKKKKDLEKLMREQNDLFNKYRDAVVAVCNRWYPPIIRANNQKLPKDDEYTNVIADCMAFGVPEPCPECGGDLTLGTLNYKCTGSISEWTKCSYTTTEPKRRLFTVPPELMKEDTIFKTYEPTVGVRVFEPAPPPTVVKQEPAEKKDVPIPPLKNLQFFIYGKLSKPKEEIKKRILKLGGLVVNKLTDTLAAVVSSKKEVEAGKNKMSDIQKADIEVVEDTFFDLIDDTITVAKSLELIKLNNIASWGSDPAKRIPQDVVDGKSIPKSKPQKSGTQKIKVKGGTSVDPDSGLEDVAHVYRDASGKYTVVLCKTDVVSQKNSYYKIQMLEADDKSAYWVFRAWGRVGTPIGGHKTELTKGINHARAQFESYYYQRTRNFWTNRDKFVKTADGYFPIEMDHGDDGAQELEKLEIDINCQLPVPVQRLLIVIFDVCIMKKTLMEFELDTEKMPLGKLSKNQIKAGYKILSELLQHIESGSAGASRVLDATNRFFTTIPHDFGVNNAPLLDNVEAIKKKTEMLDNLLEIEIAYNMLQNDEDDTTIPMEKHYSKLKADIAPLSKDSDEFKMIQEYTTNTHAATHSGYTLEIEEVFKVVREGEDQRYKPFKKLHNRRLLWHGSRVTNFAGILSQGLRIAPPEAPVTGYMFGKGVYFADMVSKSANYCFTSPRNPSGILLLCEVALGDMKECLQSCYVDKLPDGLHSTWGMGSTMPDPAMNRTLPCGTVVPLGTPVDTKKNGYLLYNEFIVYDVAQINVKYLIQMKFNYNYKY